MTISGPNRVAFHGPPAAYDVKTPMVKFEDEPGPPMDLANRRSQRHAECRRRLSPRCLHRWVLNFGSCLGGREPNRSA